MRIFILLLVIFIRGGILFAQEKDTVARHFWYRNTDLQDYPRRFISKFEVFGGLNNGWWQSKDISDRVANLAFTYGIGLVHDLNDRFEIKATLSFERKGITLDYESAFYGNPDNPNTPTKYRFIQGHDLDYLTVSVLPIYYLKDKRKFYLGAGGYASYLRKAATWTDKYFQSQLVSIYYAGYLLKEFKEYDAGLSITLGYRTRLTRKLSLNIQALYSLGLIDIINHDQPNVSPDSSLKNNVVSILMSITFNSMAVKR